MFRILIENYALSVVFFIIAFLINFFNMLVRDCKHRKHLCHPMLDFTVQYLNGELPVCLVATPKIYNILERAKKASVAKSSWQHLAFLDTHCLYKYRNTIVIEPAFKHMFTN
jgi:hypothetical protein